MTPREKQELSVMLIMLGAAFIMMALVIFKQDSEINELQNRMDVIERNK